MREIHMVMLFVVFPDKVRKSGCAMNRIRIKHMSEKRMEKCSEMKLRKHSDKVCCKKGKE